MEDLIFYRYLAYHKNNVKKWPIQSCKKYIHLKWNWLQGSLLSWSYGSWIYNSLINQFLPPLKLWVRSPFMARCTRYNIMWWSLSLLATGRLFSPGTAISSTNKTDRHDITEILLKVAWRYISETKPSIFFFYIRL